MIANDSSDSKKVYSHMRFGAVLALGILILLIWTINHQHNSFKESQIQLNELNPSANFTLQPLTKEQKNTLNGLQLVTTSDLTLISHWQHWCEPCVLELPSLNKLQSHFPKSKLTVILLNSDSIEDIPTAKKMIVDLKLDQTLNLFIKSQQNFNGFRTDVLPATWLISKDGWIVEKWLGAYNWQSISAQQLIDNALKTSLRSHQ